MSSSFHSHNKGLSTLYLVLWISLTFSACPRDLAEELKEHRPRVHELHLQGLPPYKKPLIGLFVDKDSKAVAPTGRSWAQAFRTIMEAVNVSKGEDIFVASGTYLSPNINLANKKDITLIGGYKAGELYEKDRHNLKDDEWTILDGQKSNVPVPLVTITGKAENISFSGGFIFQNMNQETAVGIVGDAPDKPIKNVAIVDCRFRKNIGPIGTGGLYRAGNGGGIYLKHGKDIRLDNLDAIDNEAGMNGGFLSIENVDGLSLFGGTWEKNTNFNAGGALYLSNVKNLKFGGQIIKNNQAGEGGGVYLEKIENASISDINFEGNTGKGGGLFLKNCRDLLFTRLTFRGNQSTSMGGGVYVEDSQNITLNFGNELLSDNSALSVGGAIAMGGAIAIISTAGAANPSENVTINGGKFVNNQASFYGGAICARGLNGFHIISGDFLGNRANLGGSILIGASSGKITLENLTVKKSTAFQTIAGGVPNGAGGGLFIVGGGGPGTEIRILNSQFVENTAAENGGAVYTDTIRYPVVFNKTLFESNNAGGYGGALALDGRNQHARFIIGEGTQFFRNESALKNGGGAILAVFDPLVAPPHKQLVFYIRKEDYKFNSVKVGADGAFMRVTVQPVNLTVPAAQEENLGARVFLPGPPNNILDRYIDYIPQIPFAPPVVVRPEDRHGIDMQDQRQVYSW